MDRRTSNALRAVALAVPVSCGTVASSHSASVDAARSDSARDGSGDSDAGCDSGDPAIACVVGVDGIYEIGTALAVDDDNVYWTKQGQTVSEDLIIATPRTGGKTVTVARATAEALASDGANVYWGAEAPVAGIFRAPVGGGNVTMLAAARLPMCIALDETNVYWTENSLPSVVATVPKEGGVTTTLWAMSPYVPSGIAVDGANVYWSAGAIMSEPKKGGAAVTLLPPSPGVAGSCGDLALSEGMLFITSLNMDYTASEIVSIPVTGGAPAVLGSTSGGSTLAVGSGSVYWTGFGPSLEVLTTPTDGGVAKTVAVPQVNSVALLATATDGSLYWTTPFQVQALLAR
jgi:hypothetical protein